MIDARDGQHRGLLYHWLIRMPEAASESRFGVEISDPKHPISE